MYHQPRRNLTPEQQLRLIGQMQENRKQSHGNNAERDDSGKYLMGQNEPTGSTAAQIAKEVGVSESTVKRAERFSKGIDTIEAKGQNEPLPKSTMLKNEWVKMNQSFPKLNPQQLVLRVLPCL